MSLQFHHFFVFVPPGAPPVDHLLKAGFTEGSSNTHLGQGTANRRLFFRNGMLEFIWVENLNELKSSFTTPTRLLERSQYNSSGFSPFGIALCPSIDCQKHTEKEPFSGWPYHPQYLSPELHIWIADNSNHSWEPMIFYLPFTKNVEVKKEPINHSNGASQIEKIVISMKSDQTSRSEAAQELESLVTLEMGKSINAEIRINGNTNAVIDLNQWCPLKIILQNGKTYGSIRKL